MIDVARDVHSLTAFKRDTPRFLEHLRAGPTSLLLTINGRAELAVMSAASFQALRERVEHLETLEAIRRGIEEADRGDVISLPDLHKVLGTHRDLDGGRHAGGDGVDPA